MWSQVFGWPLLEDGSISDGCQDVLDAVARMQSMGGVRPDVSSPGPYLSRVEGVV